MNKRPCRLIMSRRDGLSPSHPPLRGTPMRRFSSALLFAGLLTTVSAAPAEEFKLETGFTLLFNGKNLDGWKEASGKKESLEGKTEAYKGRFKVVDGVLVYDPAV